MSTPENNDWLAFDIGSRKHTWASCIRGKRESGSVTNDMAALRKLLKTLLRRARNLHVLVEATGVYYLEAAILAHELGAQVMVINPRAAHHFAQAIGQRNKTDKLDAAMLLECLMRMPFQAWEPPSPTRCQLRSYGRFLTQLTEDGTADRNRLHALENTPGSPSFLRTELKRKIALNDTRIARVRAAAVKLIEADDYLKARFEALTTFIGIAQTSAVSLLSELATMPPTLTSRACASHAGLDPRQFESGTSVHKAPRISRHGNKYLRRALFHPALSAGTHDPRAKAFKERLVGRGKKKMQANVAIMRKMLTAAWVMMKDPHSYDSEKLYSDIKST